MTGKALDGIRIIEFTDFEGAYCGRLLADLGAEVIKVEPPGGGHQRHTPPFYSKLPAPDNSIAFWVHNTSKKSVVIDLESADGQSEAKQLILSADAVIEDNPVGWMAARGLGYDAIHAAKPSLVYVSITGFGQTGPHAGYAYTDIVGQAMGGIMTLAGDPADPPNQLYGNQSDVSASIQAAQGAMLALLYAEATREGQLVDVSAQESLSMSQETAMMYWDFQKHNRTRTGSSGALAIALPGLGEYEAADGHVFLFVPAPAGAEFPVLVDWMRERGMQGQLDDEPYKSLCDNLNYRFLTSIAGDPARLAATMKDMQVIDEQLRQFVKSMPAVEMYEEGQRRRLLVGLVSTPRDIATNRQLRARNWFETIDFGDGVEVEFPGAPYRLSETPAQISHPPRLGEHSREVLAGLEVGGTL
ncbi:MAG TPA: CoA transferase [Tepidiformaceae bacterium]|nr:CoA transferase [Tepidiformaceae bacterium]